MQRIFTNKKILICVSGSIAVYKMLDCISQLRKYGAHIKVTMSAEACKFINPLSFEALSHNTVLIESTQTWSSNSTDAINHITYARWADIVLIAPATANSIAKIAYGIADSVFLSTILASNTHKILAPAMNTFMLYAKQTQNNIATLKSIGYEVIPTRSSTLVCGDDGDGALAQIDEIIFVLARALVHKSYFWKNRHVLISGGGSRESIDDVRYISNHSSGKQASALALALFILGANVSIISSAFPMKLPLGVECINADNIESFDNAIAKKIKELDSKEKKPVVFMAAALADYAPIAQSGKLKKEIIGKHLNIECLQTKDILSSISSEAIHKVGFKAEIQGENAIQYAKNMLDTKSCEMVCLNVINETNPFGGENNAIKIITREGIKDISGSKFEVALSIANSLELLLQNKKDFGTDDK